jgi:hypothetical protein
MRNIGSAILAAVALLVVFGGGCGDDTSCASESPEVEAVADCSARPGAALSYELRLCPTCNQTLAGCTVDLSDATVNGGTIFLNPTVEACESAASCGPGCNLNPTTCRFNVPASAQVGWTFNVEVFDAGSSGTKTGTLTVLDDAPSCSLPTTPI